MCVVELNVTTQDCRHRWYRLVRVCSPTSNLDNCRNKLKLEGWETRTHFCPWCDEESTTDRTEYRLMGNDRAPSIGGLSRTSSSANIEPTLTASRRESRRGSVARSDSSTSLTESAAEKNRAQNMRIQWYLTSQLETIVQGETKDRPETNRRSSLVGAPLASPSTSTSSTSSSTGSVFGKGWKKGKRISRSFFR
jgi:hypothetical protein